MIGARATPRAAVHTADAAGLRGPGA